MRTTAAIVLIGALPAAAPPSSRSPHGPAATAQTVDELIGVAAAAARRDDWATALDSLVRARRLAPGRPDLLFDLGVVLEHTGRDREAIGAYRDAVVAEPSHALAAENLASLLASHDDLDGAVHVLETALAYRPDQGSLHYHLALLLLRREQGLVGHAVLGLRRALDLGYSPPHLFLLLGRMERLGGDGAAASELLARGLRQTPDDPELLRELGLALAATGDLEAAAGALEHAVELAPVDPTIAADLGLVYSQLQRPADAISLLEPHQGSGNLDVVFLLGQAERQLGLPRARATLMRYQRLQGEAQAQREAATRATVAVSTGIEAWGQGNVAAAAAHFERALLERPGWTAARAYLAAARFDLAEVESAVALARAVLETEPDNPQALMVLGRAQLGQSLETGLATLERAADLYPFRVVCLLTLAEAYLDAGRVAGAAEMVARAGAVEPDNPWTKQLAARVEAASDRQ